MCSRSCAGTIGTEGIVRVSLGGDNEMPGTWRYALIRRVHVRGVPFISERALLLLSRPMGIFRDVYPPCRVLLPRRPRGRQHDRRQRSFLNPVPAERLIEGLLERVQAAYGLRKAVTGLFDVLNRLSHVRVEVEHAGQLEQELRVPGNDRERVVDVMRHLGERLLERCLLCRGVLESTALTAQQGTGRFR